MAKHVTPEQVNPLFTDEGGKLCAVGKKQGSQKDFVSTKDFWEKVEEPKRIRWTKQRGDESAAVEKLSKMFYANFSGTTNGGAD